MFEAKFKDDSLGTIIQSFRVDPLEIIRLHINGLVSMWV